MPFTLAYLDSPVPGIPDGPGTAHSAAGRPVDRQEHFGTEDAALRRASSLLPGPDWLDLRLYGPDGRRIAGQDQLLARLGIGRVGTEAKQGGSAGSGTGKGQSS